ncbi:MAG: ParB/RepB/Spo0J family partition protein [Thermaerobacter sp.]|nr:ParB/RepB/Spo0J family partition protein [Thermaerobacter sp.]
MMGRKLGALDEMFRDMAGRPAGAVVVEEIAVERIRPGANPRKRFPEDGMAQLADSIREHGVLQPVVVTPAGDGYVLVAGERRWRAAKLAGLATICARVREYTPEQAAAVSLIENLQREDLNEVERAEGLVALKELLGTWEAVSRATGLHLRTLYRMAKVAALPDDTKLLVAEGRVAASAAAEVMSRTGDPEQAAKMLAHAAGEGLSREQVLSVLRERDTVSPSASPGVDPPTAEHEQRAADGDACMSDERVDRVAADIIRLLREARERLQWLCVRGKVASKDREELVSLANAVLDRVRELGKELS